MTRSIYTVLTGSVNDEIAVRIDRHQGQWIAYAAAGDHDSEIERSAHIGDCLDAIDEIDEMPALDWADVTAGNCETVTAEMIEALRDSDGTWRAFVLVF